MSKVPGFMADDDPAEAVAPGTPRTLLDELLAEQQQLTAVERFAQRQERGARPAQARYYRDLIPLERPAAGQQYAFAVDLDACTGCKACVSACHSLNGLEDDEIWRNVGTLHGGTTAAPYQQTVTTACHHCLEPACLEGCPVMAYDKDPETGVVRHLDDQCIGCQYCVLKCPYDVPKYSARLGIVRKCDLCSDRLAIGEAPACVQACPTQAIRIEVIAVEKWARELRPDEVLVPGAFPSSYTQPTTRYRTTRPMPANTQPADAPQLRLEPAHWPLVAMLVLTQLACGMYGGVAVRALSGQTTVVLATVAFAVLQLGLGVSVLHLGRPLGAWRFFLGLRTSWMSREILAFGLLAGSAALCTLAAWVELLRPVRPALALLTTALGAVAVGCSAMIYIDTRRPLWAARRSLPAFFGTAALLGAAATAVALRAGGAEAAARWAGGLALALQIAVLVWETATFFTALRDASHPTHRSARTLWSLRRGLVGLRAALGVGATGCGLWALAQSGPAATFAAGAALLAATVEQGIGRYFYFVSVVAPRMPGGVVR